MTLNEVLALLPDAKQNGDGYTAKCPAHGDKRPSLSVSQGEKGVVLHCHSGCSPAAVCAALGITMRDLFVEPDRGHGHKRQNAPKRTPRARKAQRYDSLDLAVAAAGRQAGGQLTGTWCYHDGFFVVRFDKPDGSKACRPISRNGDGWVVADPDGKLPLFMPIGLPKNGEPILVCEGEKCAAAACSLGLHGVASAHGSSGATKSDWTALAGRDCVVWPDFDEAGTKYADAVATILTALDPPARVKVLDPPALWAGRDDLQEHYDIVQWLAPMDAHEPGELRGFVMSVAEAAPEWMPAPTGEGQGEALVKGDDQDEDDGCNVITLSDVEIKSIPWLWPTRFAANKFSMLVGNPGTSKSTLTCDMAARLSVGRPWPDDSACPIADTIMMSCEDGIADTIAPRVESAGGDRHRVHLLESVREGKGRRSFLVTEDVPRLERLLCRFPNTRLIVIDPITGYLGSTDSHRNSEVRGVLSPLAEFADRCGVCVLAISHLSKNRAEAIYRVIGSLAFAAAARTVYGCLFDRKDSTGERVLFLPLKSNIGPDRCGLAYHLDKTGDPVPCITWEPGVVTDRFDDALAAPDRDAPAMDAAAAWLFDLLTAGPLPAKEVGDAAQGLLFSIDTVRRAARALGVVYEKSGFGPGSVTLWKLPNSP